MEKCKTDNSGSGVESDLLSAKNEKERKKKRARLKFLRNDCELIFIFFLLVKHRTFYRNTLEWLA